MSASIEAILARLGGTEAAARLAGVGTEAVRKWRQSGVVPPKHWPALMAAGLTLAELRGLPAEPPAPEPAANADAPPEGATAVLVLADGTVAWGRGFGAHTDALGTGRVGELCFNTGMTGYQETLTDPSYAGQIITFTFPHIGNTGANPEDLEATNIAALGLAVKADVTAPSNWRAAGDLGEWLRARGVPGISGVDTRSLTLRVRDGGPPSAVLCFPADGRFDLAALRARAQAWPGLEGRTWRGRCPARNPTSGPAAAGAGARVSLPRASTATTSSPWTTAPSATSCAAWPTPAAASP